MSKGVLFAHQGDGKKTSAPDCIEGERSFANLRTVHFLKLLILQLKRQLHKINEFTPLKYVRHLMFSNYSMQCC